MALQRKGKFWFFQWPVVPAMQAGSSLFWGPGEKGASRFGCQADPECFVTPLVSSKIGKISFLTFLQTKELIHYPSKKCLDIAKSKKHEDGLIVTKCDGSLSQRWNLEAVPWR